MVNWLDVSAGLFLAVVPAIVTFIDRDPTAAVEESQVHVPPVPPLEDQDVGKVEPLSNEPFGATLDTVAGSSR
jgi:hypothetical protein